MYVPLRAFGKCFPNIAEYMLSIFLDSLLFDNSDMVTFRKTQ